MKTIFQIPRNLPQFEKPALFVSSGEYEANFYLVFMGKMIKKEQIKMPPREEAKEKQGFVGRKGGMQSLSAVSHHGAYIEDLKKKFQKIVHRKIHDFIAEFKLEEIYLFAPRYASKRIIDGLDKSEQKKVRMKFFKELTKINPLEMIKIFQKELEKIKVS